MKKIFFKSLEDASKLLKVGDLLCLSDGVNKDAFKHNLIFLKIENTYNTSIEIKCFNMNMMIEYQFLYDYCIHIDYVIRLRKNK